MEVLHIIFPINKLAREWKLVCWGLCCLVGYCWRHAHLFFDGEDKRQHEGKCNESDGGKCLTQAQAGAVRIRLSPNRATPASIKIGRPPINDGGTTYGAENG